MPMCPRGHGNTPGTLRCVYCDVALTPEGDLEPPPSSPEVAELRALRAELASERLAGEERAFRRTRAAVWTGALLVLLIALGFGWWRNTAAERDRDQRIDCLAGAFGDENSVDDCYE